MAHKDSPRTPGFVRSQSRWLLAIGAVALVCYLPGFWWGAPHATDPLRTDSWGVDDETPLGPLAEISNIIEPTENRNLGYPLMHPFMTAAAYAPYMGFLVLSGGMSQPSGEYPFGLSDPVGSLETLSRIAHFLAVLFGVGCVLSAFAVGTLAWDRATGLLAALMALSLYPMFYYARTGNVDVPALLFVGLGAAAFANILRHGFTVKNAIWLGVWAGFAVATKESMAGAFALMPFVLVTGVGLDGATSVTVRDRVRPALAGLGAAVLALGTGSGLFVEPSRYIAHLEYTAAKVKAAATVPGYVVQTHPYTWSGSVALARSQLDYLVDAMTLPGVMVALLGIVWVIRAEPRKSLLLAPAVGYATYMFWTARVTQLRYMLPVAFLLTWLVARAVVLAWRSRRSWAGPLVSGAFGLAVLLGLLRGLDLTHAMINDSRWAAGSWLAERLEPGDGVEHFGPFQKLPPLEAGVTSRQATLYMGMFVETDRSERTTHEILRGWAERRPEFVIVIPDHTSVGAGGPHNVSLPPSLFESLMDGRTPYELQATFPTPSLLPWVRRPDLDYPTVSPPIRVFGRTATGRET